MPPAILVSYPVSGIVLSRFISRRVVWWRQANSLRAIAANNVRTILTWPTAVPKLVASLAAARFL
jgi:hypothetical protein